LLLREWITTVIPSALSRRAVASPIPDVDPVTNATAFSIPAASQIRRFRQLSAALGTIRAMTANPDLERHPLRRRILATLDREQSLSELAASLRVTDARLLWHLERLEAARQVSPTAGRWTRTASGDEAATRNPAGSRQVLPQDAVHDYEQAIAETQDGLHGDDFVQCGGEHGSRMSREQAEEFGDRLQSLVAEYFAPGRGDRSGTKYGFYWILSPVDLHPLGDD
jgi:hypothetical protein